MYHIKSSTNEIYGLLTQKYKLYKLDKHPVNFF